MQRVSGGVGGLGLGGGGGGSQFIGEAQNSGCNKVKDQVLVLLSVSRRIMWIRARGESEIHFRPLEGGMFSKSVGFIQHVHQTYEGCRHN